MGIRFNKIYEDDMKLIADSFQQTAANFKIILERIESLEDRLMKLEKIASTPHFEAGTDDGETET